MNETIKIEIELDTAEMKEADAIMKKMLKSLNVEDLLKIKENRIIKTLVEIDVDASFYQDEPDQQN